MQRSQLERKNPALEQMRRKIDSKDVDHHAGQVQASQFFEAVSRSLRRKREALPTPAGVGQFVIRGANGGVWTVDLSGARVSRGIGGRVACRITTDAETFSAFINGRDLNELEREGRITIGGDRRWIAKLGRILCTPGR
jgi:hypothetical protein